MSILKRNLVLGVTVVLGISGCHKGSQQSPAASSPQTATLAPADINQSFSSDGDTIKIQQSALGKMFLLRSQIKIVTNTPSWDDMKPLIVVFQTNGSELGMFAVNTFAAYDVLDTKQLVASFKILSSTKTDITFSWGGGAKFVSNESISDAGGTPVVSIEQSGASSPVSVVSNFLEYSTVTQNLLVVREDDTVVGETTQTTAGQTTQVQQQQDIVVDYRIEPYQPNPAFKATEADAFHHFGFFVTNLGIPQKSQSSEPLAMHWDMSKGPITYAISKYFPASVKQAVQEGVLYWNNVLGPNSVKVVMDVDPEQDFPDRTVVVNWLPWNDAAASWAGLAADPMTGEIINGKVYITSVFLQLDAAYSFANGVSAGNGSLKKISLNASGSTINCEYPAIEIAHALDNLPPQGAARQPYLNDTLRHVVAHEVGHTLGLRHNFAASYDSPLTATQINAEKLKYVSDPKHPGAEVTTSIMDYIGSLEMGLAGRWILNHALKYDLAALKWVANPAAISAENSTLKFCTDEDIGASNNNNGVVLYGCDRFDAPGNPLNIGSTELKVAFGSSVQRLLYRIVDALKTSDPNGNPSIDTVLNQDLATSAAALSPAADVTPLLGLVLNYASSSSAPTGAHKSVYFETAMPHNWDFDPSTLPDVGTLLAQDMTEVGGIAALARTFLPYDANGKLIANPYVDQLQAVLSSKDFTSGTTLNGNAYTLTPDQQTRIAEYMAASVNAVSAQLFVKLVPMLNFTLNSSQWQYGFSLQQANDLEALAMDLSFWQNGTMNGTVQSVAVTLPTYLGAGPQRALAAQIGNAKPISVLSGTMNDYKQDVSTRVGKDLSIVYSSLKLAPTDPQMPASLKTSADHTAFITALAQKGLISNEVVVWAQDEIALLAAVEAQ